jgi:hypothetical protein
MITIPICYTLKEKKEVCRTIFGSAALTEPFKSSA